MVHAEVVLQGDGGEGLRGSFHSHMFLCLHGLVQSVAPTATFHDTTGLLVNDFHLTVNYHILVVFVEHGVRLQQLLQSVYSFTLHAIVGQHFVFLVQSLLVRE